MSDARPPASAPAARVILAVQGIRALLYGFTAVVLGSAFVEEGFSAVWAGVLFTAMLAGMAAGSLVVGRWAEAVGTRRLYILLFCVLGVAGTAFAVTAWIPALFVAALTGTISTDANESGPITSLEQSMLSGFPSRTRTRIFGWYNAVAYLGGSAGALLAAVPPLVRQATPAAPSEQRWLLAYPILAAVCIVVALRLPRDAHPAAGAVPTGLRSSRGNVRRLAALFAVDALAGGLVVQSFMVFWFEREFRASAAVMGVVFFAVGLLQAASSLLAPPLAHRAGLLNTMVFTHLPSNVLLALIPLMPTLPLAIALLLARSTLSQMDVPTRQAYLAAMVEPRERTAAAAYTNSARYAARPAGPAIAGALVQVSAVGAPFVVAGAIKCAYDLAVLRLFRGTSVDEGRPAQAIPRG